MESYYSYHRITFTKPQMKFLYLHLAELKMGEYPKPNRETGYIDPSIISKNYKEPARNKVLELAAELEFRLDIVLPCISEWERPRFKIIKRNGRWTFRDKGK